MGYDCYILVLFFIGISKTLKDISKRSGKFLKNVGVPTVRRIDGFSCRLKL
ncbi:hypothetical protein LEP1GSC188_1670 [Leptospira weilii serovar Topaz str. LT2116]|uniref:Uncharacterized protein n=1 Tax=Leptospira weilii serovar Topaz str. LT2116 TaxID=1088540 RepID=M3G122_9LEPT|nr:hypothetical protein LEP1GSC188_0596 [Leptospira weilii serovar Topaz str. LT2116]EMF79624.1 hypothetical protein LEP1GSC188_1670 [Leptospira weilii serovar Topaz str. LT2116]